MQLTTEYSRRLQRRRHGFSPVWAKFPSYIVHCVLAEFQWGQNIVFPPQPHLSGGKLPGGATHGRLFLAVSDAQQQIHDRHCVPAASLACSSRVEYPAGSCESAAWVSKCRKWHLNEFPASRPQGRRRRGDRGERTPHFFLKPRGLTRDAIFRKMTNRNQHRYQLKGLTQLWKSRRIYPKYRVRLSSALVSQKSASAHARALRRPRREFGCQMERRSWAKPPRPRAEAPASGLPCWDEQYQRMCAQKMKQYSANKCIFQWWPLNQNTLLSMFDRSKTTYQTPLPLIADIKIGNMSFTYAFLISEQW